MNSSVLHRQKAIQTSAHEGPVVVVGAGPVGIRFVQTLHERDPLCKVVIYGREPWAPYNRVRLSTFLTGETNWSELHRGFELPDSAFIEPRLHCEVVSIDRERRCVVDGQGRSQPYGTLVLATGSRARIPDLPGIGQAHVYALRDMHDAQALLARRTRSVRTVVLGGGLLGLEAARAMQRFNTEVIVVEHADRLMARQLDEGASALLRRQVLEMGLQVRTGEAVKAIRGHGQVNGVELRSGEVIPCDTVVIAVGIVPDVRLARDAGIAVGRGIRVEDDMRSSDPDVLALGECCEHREQVYGLVAPGLEQAAVAAHTVLGGQARYTGSLLSTRLKVAGLPVFSAGTIDPAQTREPLLSLRHGNSVAYRAVMLQRGRVVGAVAVGPCDQLDRLQEAVLTQRRVWFWQRWRWQREGRLWAKAQAASVVDWPDGAIVCHCNQVSRRALSACMAEGACSVAAMSQATRAGTVCGSCRPLLAELAEHAGAAAEAAPPVRGWRLTMAGAGLALLLGLALSLLPGLAYWQSVQGDVAWQRIWTDGEWKQWSGYAVLALSLAGLLMSLRKRVSAWSAGHFDFWRLAHVLLGVVAVAALAVHTGARIGANMDAVLMLCFVGLVVVGGIGAAVIAQTHRLPARQLQRWRRVSLWAHLLLSWPLPVLLGLHVLKSYWF